MKKFLLSTALIMLTGPAFAEIAVTKPAAFETAAGMKVGAATLTLEADQDDRLIAASSPVAERVEIHSMTMNGGVMKMRKLDGLDLPAGKAVTLEPTGYHLMLIGLRQPLAAGASFPLTLEFAHEKPKAVTVAISSRKTKVVPDAMPHHHD